MEILPDPEGREYHYLVVDDEGRQSIVVTKNGDPVGTLLAAAAVPEAESEPRRLSKLEIGSRMTDSEIDLVQALYAGTAEQRRWIFLWDQAVVIDPDDPLTLAGFTAVFGAERAAQLLG